MMIATQCKRYISGFTFACLLLTPLTSAHADVAWTRWNSAVPGSARGTINVSGSAPISVTYTGEVYFAQTNNTGTYFWNPASTFTSADVPNQPATSDLIAIVGGNSTMDTLTFSQFVHNPVMNILSLGDPGDPITYNFDEPFTILSDGPSAIYGGPGTLNQLPGNILQGIEGDGTIQFLGDFISISWTVPTAETYHGFTVGTARLTTVPEPGSVALVLSLTMSGAAFFVHRRKQAHKAA